jgi:hypothetical protein
VQDFTAEDGSKGTYYIARWQNIYGETGPWSETVMATLPA